MHILIAPNAFKHALDAKDVAAAIERGLLASKLSCTCECFPVGDGGNGTGQLLVERLGGEVVDTPVTDPLGRPIVAPFGLVDGGKTAIIEMADASGLHLLRHEERDPLHATTFGTGQLINAALAKGVRRIIMGMGGSATVDGGSGMLMALGVRFLDTDGHEITDLPIGLERLHAVDRSAMDSRLGDTEIVVLCDVTNPLLGSEGASAVFGPQKGASPEQVVQLDNILQRYADRIEAATGVAISTIPSGGVAGGASAVLAGLVGAQLVSGIDYFLEMTRFTASLSKAQLVITGEGSIDRQTLQGKGPYGVAKRAKEAGVPVIGLAGRVPIVIDVELNTYFDALLAIGNGTLTLPEALSLTGQNLCRVATQLGHLIARFTGP